MKKLISIFCFLIICFSVSAQKTNYKHINSIGNINKTVPDTFYITAFVTELYNCPPCPPGAQCKPCIGDHVVLSDKANKKTETIRAFTETPNDFAAGKKYTFLVRAYKIDSRQQPDITVLSSKIAK